MIAKGSSHCKKWTIFIIAVSSSYLYQRMPSEREPLSCAHPPPGVQRVQVVLQILIHHLESREYR
jgi:hypothetical protein